MPRELFVLGVLWDRLRAHATLIGMSVGAAVAGGSTLLGLGSIGGLQPGLVALLLNFALAITLSHLETGERKSTLPG